ncbi:MAG: hypothetical protein PHS82_15295 [Lachnospiraceae bacterium]|nr:hypothetical protein [Lachnospiraceae bacterium]
MEKSKHLKYKKYTAIVTVLITLVVAATVTFAWYVYNTEKHTTNVHMAAGAGASLQISNTYGGTYGQSAVLEEFVGTLNPVSTNVINGGDGFQKVLGFSNGSEMQPNLVASLFGGGEFSDYYNTQLFLRSNGGDTRIYLADIGYEDSNAAQPISTAIRVGIVTHKPGQNQPVDREYVFAINQGANPEAEYNTATGQEGYVLDSAKTDGTTVPFTPYTSDNYCDYDSDTGMVSLKTDSVPLCTVGGTDGGDYGDSVQVDIYIWLEGCDKDCTGNLSSMTLRNLALSFAGYTE